MMSEASRTLPLAEFLGDHERHIARLKQTGQPQFLTIDGKAEVVVLDADSYGEMIARLERRELADAVREGLAAADRGEMKPAEQVYAEIRGRYGLPD